VVDEPGRVRLEDMIGHDELVEKYDWLSGQMLNKWKSTGAIRFFHGARGKVMYPLQDVEAALNADLQLGEAVAPGQKPVMTSQGKMVPASSTMSEADQIRERMFRESLVPRNRRNSGTIGGRTRK